MNIQSFAMISAAYINPTAYGDLHGANYRVWLFSHLLADEKFMTIFSLLFGAGILLMTRRMEAAGRPPAPSSTATASALFGKLERVAQLEVVLAVWLLQLILSPLWLARFRFGPLEWLWRSLTYWERQRFLRSSGQTVLAAS